MGSPKGGARHPACAKLAAPPLFSFSLAVFVGSAQQSGTMQTQALFGNQGAWSRRRGGWTVWQHRCGIHRHWGLRMQLLLPSCCCCCALRVLAAADKHAGTAAKPLQRPAGELRCCWRSCRQRRGGADTGRCGQTSCGSFASCCPRRSHHKSFTARPPRCGRTRLSCFLLLASGGGAAATPAAAGAAASPFGAPLPLAPPPATALTKARAPSGRTNSARTGASPRASASCAHPAR